MNCQTQVTTSPSTMTLAEAIHQRHSVRGFQTKAVPQNILDEIFGLAQLAPSNCNIQPWQVAVASGASRDELRRRMVERAMTGVAINPDFEHLPKFENAYRDRQVECAYALYNNMGIARDDKPGRAMAMLRNFELFDAPHVCFIGMDRSFGVTVAVDVGMYAQNLMLAMTAYGVGACAQGSMRYYPDDVREVLGLDSNIAILFGISFGYEDASVPANRTRTTRAALSECVKFFG